MGLKELASCLESGSGGQLVVLVSYGLAAPDGFEQYTRDALLVEVDRLKREVMATDRPRVLCLHVPRDTVAPVVVLRSADVVLNVTKARHG